MTTKMELGKEFELHFLCDFYDWIGKKYEKYQVYAPWVDDSGIDYAIRTANGEYKEIQVKARKEKKLFTITNDFKVRSNYWFIFYCQDKSSKKDKDNKEEYKRYILPSEYVKKHLTKNKHIRISADTPHYDFDDIFKE